MHYSIDEICRAGCTTPRGVRFWQEKGLLGDVARSEGNQRRFDDAHLDKARIIAAAQFGGFSLDETRAIVADWNSSQRLLLLERLRAQAEAAAKLAESLPGFGDQVMLDL